MNPKKYPILEQHWIAEELRIKVLKTTQSPNWYLQYNDEQLGQRRISLKTSNVKQARVRAGIYVRAIVAGEPVGNKKVRTSISGAITALLDGTYSRNDSNRDKKRHFAKLQAWCDRHQIAYLDQLNVSTMQRIEKTLRDHGIGLPESFTQQNRRKRRHVAQPLAPRTVRGMMKAIRSLILDAVDLELIAKDPCPAYRVPPEPDDEIQVFTPEELELIYEDELLFKQVWQFLFDTCLRRREFCWLQKEDVVYDSDGCPSALLIRKKVCPLTGRSWKPKHGKHRTIPLTERGRMIVEDWIKTFEGPWLFPAIGRKTAGGRWHGDDLLKRLQLRLRAVGINHGNLHTFRHSGASYYANRPGNPVPLPQLQRFLGHKSILTTQRYLHVNVSDITLSIRASGTNGSPPNDRSGHQQYVQGADRNKPSGNGGEPTRIAS